MPYNVFRELVFHEGTVCIGRHSAEAVGIHDAADGVGVEKDLREFFSKRPYLGFRIMEKLDDFNLNKISPEAHCVVVDRNLFDRKGFRYFVESVFKTKRHLIELSKFYRSRLLFLFLYF